jgi:hypothetical protein
MMKMQNWLVAAGIAAALCAGAGNGLAQQDNGGGGGGGGGAQGGGRRGGFGGDPAQFRQRMVERYKEDLEVTKDDEWQALQPRIEKVMDARFASMAGMGRGMFGRRGGPGGPGGPGGGDNAQGAQRRGPFGQASLPEADALQKAVDAKASGAELKATLAKFTAARKAKEEELKTAQEELRKLLTPRQEAIAALNGLL